MSDSKAYMKRRATVIGLAKREVSEGSAVYIVFDVLHPKRVKLDGGKSGTILPVPIIVSAPLFGAEDMTGPVRVTVLVEQLSQEELNRIHGESGSKLVVVGVNDVPKLTRETREK